MHSLILLHEVDTCYNGSLCYIGIYFQLLSIVPAASNLPFMDSKYKFTKYFTEKGLNTFLCIRNVLLWSEIGRWPTVILNSVCTQIMPQCGINRGCATIFTHVKIIFNIINVLSLTYLYTSGSQSLIPWLHCLHMRLPQSADCERVW